MKLSGEEGRRHGCAAKPRPGRLPGISSRSAYKPSAALRAFTQMTETHEDKKNFTSSLHRFIGKSGYLYVVSGRHITLLNFAKGSLGPGFRQKTDRQRYFSAETDKAKRPLLHRTCTHSGCCAGSCWRCPVSPADLLLLVSPFPEAPRLTRPDHSPQLPAAPSHRVCVKLQA